MMKFKDIINHLRYFFYMYIVAFVVILISLTMIINVVSNPSEDERVTVFIISNSSNTKNLDDYLYDLRPDYIEAVNVNAHAESDEYLSEAYLTSGLELSDCFILSAGYLESNSLYDDYLALDTQKINDYCSHTFDYYIYNGCAIGIKLYDKETKEGLLKEYISYGNDDYYLFINSSTKQAFNPNNGIFDLLNKITK